jgi:hypothetical protein
MLSPAVCPLQVLSVRAALFQIMNATADENRLVFLGTYKKANDFLHVSLLGHRW